MNSFLLAISVVLPLIIYMVIGGIIEKRGIFSKENFKTLNVMIFKVLIPLTLFFSVYQADVKEAVNPGIFVFVLGGLFIVYVIAWLVVSAWVTKGEDAAAIIQGMYRSNYVLFGNSIAMSLCTDGGIALVSALAAVVVPVFNILAVILFEVKRGGSVDAKQIVINIFKNPLVDAGILGIIFCIFHVPIPEFVQNPLQRLASAATPLALVTLGGILTFGSMVKHKRYLIITAICRLVVIPFVILAAAIGIGIRGDALVAILAVFASPTAVASVPMAQTMGGNGELAGEIVATTSVGCILTIFLFVFGLSQLGFIGI